MRIAALLLFAVVAATLRAQDPSGETGSRLFLTHCSTCHGLDAQGGEHGPNITRTQANIETTITAGIPARGMPSFAQTLSPQQIQRIAAFVGTLKTKPEANPLSSIHAQVRPSDLLAAPVAGNWSSYNGDYTGRRFSSLAQITPANASQLRAQWVFHAAQSNLLEGTPVVVDGVLLITAANDVFALDASTGRTLWHYHRAVTNGLIDDASAHHSRGVAVWERRVFIETDNAHLVCLDIANGKEVWDVSYAPATNKNYGATSVPLVVKDQVIVGTSGGDDGVRGFIAAFNAATGKEVWRFWTIPGPGEKGSESWPGEMYLRGGATAWMPGTYDPALNTIFWGTSNPAPDFDGAPRPGDDLYTDCLLALDPDTGRLKWHFQFTPHDLYDYDAVETPVLVDTADGRKWIVQANRNGFFYVLDRANGKFIQAAPFVKKLNWATGIDRQGRPIRSGLQPSPDGTVICPDMTGATNWFSPSYNPATGLFYFIALESCHQYFLKPENFQEGHEFYATGVKSAPGAKREKILLAFDPRNVSERWRLPLPGDGQSWAGTMTTAGGLLFFGNDEDGFAAADAATGKPLWEFRMGQSVHASPMSYSVNNKQYVAIAAGSDLFTFGLP